MVAEAGSKVHNAFFSAELLIRVPSGYNWVGPLGLRWHWGCSGAFFHANCHAPHEINAYVRFHYWSGYLRDHSQMKWGCGGVNRCSLRTEWQYAACSQHINISLVSEVEILPSFSIVMDHETPPEWWWLFSTSFSSVIMTLERVQYQSAMMHLLISVSCIHEWYDNRHLHVTSSRHNCTLWPIAYVKRC